jgi:hypothetical protein
MAAGQLRQELEDLTGKQVRLDILQVPGPVRLRTLAKNQVTRSAVPG